MALNLLTLHKNVTSRFTDSFIYKKNMDVCEFNHTIEKQKALPIPSVAEVGYIALSSAEASYSRTRSHILSPALPLSSFFFHWYLLTEASAEERGVHCPRPWRLERNKFPLRAKNILMF